MTSSHTNVEYRTSSRQDGLVTRIDYIADKESARRNGVPNFYSTPTASEAKVSLQNELNYPLQETSDEGYRKLKIGDLSSIDRQRQRKELTRVKTYQGVTSASNWMIGQTQTTKTRQENCTLAPITKYTAPQYNRDPINDPKYEKKSSQIFGRRLSSTGASHPTDTFNLYYRENSMHAERRGIRTSEEREISFFSNDINLKACPAAGRVITSSEKQNRGEGNPEQKGGETRVSRSKQRTSLVMLTTKQRSCSEPPAHRTRKRNANQSSTSAEAMEDLEKCSRDKHTETNLMSAKPMQNVSSSAVLSLPLKVTSFTSSGDEITQEYIFTNKKEHLNSKANFTTSKQQEDNVSKKKSLSKVESEQVLQKKEVKLQKEDTNSTLPEAKKDEIQLTDTVFTSTNNCQSESNEQTTGPPNSSGVPHFKHSSNLPGEKPDSAAVPAFESRSQLRQGPFWSAPSSPVFRREKRIKMIDRFRRKANWDNRSASAGSSPHPESSGSLESITSLLNSAHKVHRTLLLKQNVLLNDKEKDEDIQAEAKGQKSSVDEDVQSKLKEATISRSASDPLKKKGDPTKEKKKSYCKDSTIKDHNIHFLSDDIEEKQDIGNRRRSEAVVSTHLGNDRSFEDSSFDEKLPSSHQVEIQSESIRPTARRAAVVSTLPDSDLSVLSDTIATLQRNQPIALSSQFKRSRWNFPKLNFMNKDKDRSRDQKLEEVLANWKQNTTDQNLDTILEEIKNCKRRVSGTSGDSSPTNENRLECKRHNAVWELFTSERTYLKDHLLVLLQVFMEPLQELQCEGFLLFVDVRSLFGNLEELCKVSMEFCHTLLDVVGDKRSYEFGDANSIDTAFETFDKIICPPYQRYFTGYGTSLTDREELKSNEDYVTFIEWCEQNPRCQRLKLNDLLISPMQRLTKFPLLLRNIAEYTADKSQNASIERTLAAVQESLRTLEGKVTCLNHFQFLQDLQSSIFWPPVYEMDTKTVLPEPLRNALSQQTCRNLIANPKRQVVFEGLLSAVENGKLIEIYGFLFDDMLLLTKPKKGKRKPSEVPSSLKSHSCLKDGTLLSVHRQPIALDRFMVYDVDPEHLYSIGSKRSFVLVQENRFQQMYGIIMLQAPTEDMKRSWLTKLASTAAQWMEKNVYGQEQSSASSPMIKRTIRSQKTVSTQQVTSSKLEKTKLNIYSQSTENQSSNNDNDDSSRSSSSTSEAKIEVDFSDATESA